MSNILPVGKLFGHMYVFEAYRDGELLWKDENHNLVVNEGLDHVLENYYKGSSYTAQHWVGITNHSPSFAADDTMSSHPGWAEITDYSEGYRPSYSPGTVSSQSVDNSGSKAVFTINADGTDIGGGFLVVDSEKGGTSGPLIGGAAFSGGDRTLASGDTLNVTVTATMSSS